MNTSPLIKICGTTSINDAHLAADAGADFLGIIIEHPPSPRSISLAQACEIAEAVAIPIVAVTVNKSIEELEHIHQSLVPHALQLHGDESPELVQDLVTQGARVWAAVSGTREVVLQRARAMAEAGAEAVLVDARLATADGIIYGGTGHTSDWGAARILVDEGLRVILAGGLTLENVTKAIEEVQPWMVDVISGVEARKGVKDGAKIVSFIDSIHHREL